MKILHTEASTGWGGQEIRILREAEGMRARGHDIVFAVAKGAQLAIEARWKGFTVYEFPIAIKHALSAIWHLVSVILKEDVEIVNTHSSADAWLGGIAARITRCKVIRTRHLSTPSKPGWNSRVLFNKLADATVTTCEVVAQKIQQQADLPPERCLSIPTGVDPEAARVTKEQCENMRRSWGWNKEDCIIGTVCVLRSWKGISDLLQAAKLLQNQKHLKWVIVGPDGPNEPQFREEWKRLGLQDNVLFTGNMKDPYPAIAAMDIFALLSTGHEGVSQASLMAAFLKRPLITTKIGGLPEVCVNGITGYQVPIRAGNEVAEKVEILSKDVVLREQMGEKAHQLVNEKFTIKHTLDGMEKVYQMVTKR